LSLALIGLTSRRRSARNMSNTRGENNAFSSCIRKYVLARDIWKNYLPRCSSGFNNKYK
jgi:hypothetical protein